MPLHPTSPTLSMICFIFIIDLATFTSLRFNVGLNNVVLGFLSILLAARLHFVLHAYMAPLKSDPIPPPLVP